MHSSTTRKVIKQFFIKILHFTKSKINDINKLLFKHFTSLSKERKEAFMAIKERRRRFIDGTVFLIKLLLLVVLCLGVYLLHFTHIGAAVVAGSLLLLIIIKTKKQVREGTAVAFTRFGALHDVNISWKNHFLDKNFEVWDKQKAVEAEQDVVVYRRGERLLGGLVFPLFWPMVRPYRYSINWKEGRGQSGIEHEKVQKMDSIPLRPEIYYSTVTHVFTHPQFGRIGMFLKYYVEVRIINVEKYLFISPSSSIDGLLTMIDDFMRSFAARVGFDVLFSVGRQSKELWEGINPDSQYWEEYKNTMKTDVPVEGISSRKEYKEKISKYGLKISERGLWIEEMEIEDPEIVTAFTQDKKEELLGNARVTKAEKDREAKRQSLGYMEDLAEKYSIEYGISKHEAWKLVDNIRKQEYARDNNGFIVGDFGEGDGDLPSMFAKCAMALKAAEGGGGKKESPIKTPSQSREMSKELRDRIDKKMGW